MSESGDNEGREDEGELSPEDEKSQTNEIPEEEEFNPNEDPDEISEEEEFDPNEDPNEISEEEEFNPNEDPDEISEEEKFDPNEDPDEISEEEEFNPNDEETEEIPEEEEFNPNDENLNEEPDIPRADNFNPNTTGTVTVIITHEPEHEPEQDPKDESEQDLETEPEQAPEDEQDDNPDELVFVSPDGTPMPRVESREIETLRGEIEEIEAESDMQPESKSDMEGESESDLEPEAIPYLEPKSKSEEEINESSEEQWDLVTPEGETMSPIEMAIKELYEPEQEDDSELDISEQEYNQVPDQKSELLPEQESELIPERRQKKKRIKAKKIMLITNPDELGNYKPYEYQHIVKTKYDVIFSEKKTKYMKKKIKNEKKKPKRVKDLDLITNPEEFGNYTNYNDSKTTQRQGKQPSAKSETKEENSNKSAQNKISTKVKELELVSNTEKLKLGDQNQTNKSSKKSETKIKETVQKQRNLDTKDLELETQKLVKSNKDSNIEKRIINIQKEKLFSKSKQKLGEKYRQETGRRPFYNKKETKAFLAWLGKQWEILLRKWILEAKERKISKKIKQELIRLIEKYQFFREIYLKLNNLLKRNNLSKESHEDIEKLLKKLEKIDPIELNIFRNLRAFRSLYNRYFMWNINEILKEREKFVNFLSRKLEYLKKVEKNTQDYEKSWKEILKENLYKNTKLNLNEKSIIIKLIQKDNFGKLERDELISLLKKLPTVDLIALLGKNFEKLTKTYVRWGWDFHNYIKKNMLHDYLCNYQKYSKVEKNEDWTNQLKEFLPNRDELTFREWLLSYNPLKINKNIRSQVRSTLGFIESLREELKKIISQDFLRKKNGILTLSDRKMSLFLGSINFFINRVIQKVKKEGYHKIALDVLIQWKNKLKSYSGLTNSAEKAIELIDAYIELNKPVIPISRKQDMQLYRYHRFIKENFFSIIDTIEKAYWLGFFFADGSIINKKGKRNYISFFLKLNDSVQIIRFCGSIGLNPNYIYHKVSRKFYKGEWRYYKAVGIGFASNKIANDLFRLGFQGSKSKKTEWPKIKFDNPILDLAFLLGFYDGEGKEGRTDVKIGSYQIIEQIKKRFNIPYEISHTEGQFRLSLGAQLMNLIQSVFKKSLPRKRKIFRPQNYSKSNSLGFLTSDLLHNLIKRMKPEQLAKILKLEDVGIIYSLMSKWDIHKEQI